MTDYGKRFRNERFFVCWAQDKWSWSFWLQDKWSWSMFRMQIGGRSDWVFRMQIVRVQNGRQSSPKTRCLVMSRASWYVLSRYSEQTFRMDTLLNACSGLVGVIGVNECEHRCTKSRHRLHRFLWPYEQFYARTTWSEITILMTVRIARTTWRDITFYDSTNRGFFSNHVIPTFGSWRTILRKFEERGQFVVHCEFFIMHCEFFINFRILLIWQ